MIIIRLIFAAYCVWLTVMLVVPDPWALLGLSFLQGGSPSRGIHFVSFAVLALLTFASRFREPAAALFVMLLGYGVAVEMVQVWVPGRIIEGIDVAENVLGLSLGTIVWFGGKRYAGGKRKV